MIKPTLRTIVIAVVSLSYATWTIFVISLVEPGNSESYEGATWWLLYTGLPSTIVLALTHIGGNPSMAGILIYAIVGGAQWILVACGLLKILGKAKKLISHNQAL